MLDRLAQGIELALRSGAAPLLLGARLAGRAASPSDPAVPARKSGLAIASKIVLDEIFFASELASATFVARRDHRRVVLETEDALAFYEDRGWLADPSDFHRTPPPLERLTLTRVYRPRLPYLHLRAPSGYAPHPGEPGRQRWLGYAPTHTLHAWLLRHAGRPRPWLVCIPGYRMGQPLIDFTGFRARWLHQTLGVNVAIPVLPLHGPRRVGPTRRRRLPVGRLRRHRARAGAGGLGRAAPDRLAARAGRSGRRRLRHLARRLHGGAGGFARERARLRDRRHPRQRFRAARARARAGHAGARGRARRLLARPHRAAAARGIAARARAQGAARAALPVRGPRRSARFAGSGERSLATLGRAANALVPRQPRLVHLGARDPAAARGGARHERALRRLPAPSSTATLRRCCGTPSSRRCSSRSRSAARRSERPRALPDPRRRFRRDVRSPASTLITTQQIVLTTDRDGVAAFWEPGLMGRSVFFQPAREGWTIAARSERDPRPRVRGLSGRERHARARSRSDRHLPVTQSPEAPTRPPPSASACSRST